MIRSSADEIKSSVDMEDKLEEFFPRLLRYLKEDLSAENLTSEAENVRLQLIQLTEDLSRDSAAKQIDAKYGNVRRIAGEAASVQVRTGVLEANALLLLPFGRPSSEDVKDGNSAKMSEHQNENSSANLKTMLPNDSPVNDVYEEMFVLRPAKVNSGGGGGGGDSSSRAPSKPFIGDPHAYADTFAFGFATDRIPEATTSESESDYEDYEKDDRNDKELSDSKSDDRGEGEAFGSVSLRYSGVLYRSGESSGHGGRQLCGIRGGSFVCFEGISSFKVILELALSEYEVTVQEKSDLRSPACTWTHQLRFSGPAKETHLFYAANRQDAESWLKELHKSTSSKQDSFETNAEDKKPQNNSNNNQREEDVSAMKSRGGGGEGGGGGGGGGGSSDRDCPSKAINQLNHQPQPTGDDVRKKSKLQSFFETVGKKRRNKNKNSQQAPDVISPQQNMDSKPGSGYLSIWSEVYTGDRWFKRFCRIEDGRLNCYGDHVTDSRPEFSLCLRGAQLKPLDAKDGLKITIVQDKMEHRLKMSDFMDHGKWLASLIRETGFALQLSNAASKSSSKVLSPFQAPTGGGGGNSDDVILNESFSDEEPPPLPEYSPPSSPCPNEIDIGGERGGVADGEGIYQEPTGWLVELEEIQRKKKLQKNQSHVKIPSIEEESLYVNREFQITDRKSSKETRKFDQKEKSHVTTSSSFPDIAFAELTKAAKGEGEGEGDEGRARRVGGGGGGGGAIRKNDVISDGKRNNRNRPSSGKMERKENAKGGKFDYLHLNTDVDDDSGPLPLPATVSSMSQGKRQDGRETKTTDSCRDPVGVEANIGTRRTGRAETVSGHDVILSSSSTRTSDCNGKKVVQDLVKIFERRT